MCQHWILLKFQKRLFDAAIALSKADRLGYSDQYFVFFKTQVAEYESLGTLAANATGELHVFAHDGDALGVDSAQIHVLKEVHEVGLTSLMESSERVRGEANIVGGETLCNLAHETLERAATNEQLGRLLVLANHGEYLGARTESAFLVGDDGSVSGDGIGTGDHTLATGSRAEVGRINVTGAARVFDGDLFAACHTRGGLWVIRFCESRRNKWRNSIECIFPTESVF